MKRMKEKSEKWYSSITSIKNHSLVIQPFGYGGGDRGKGEFILFRNPLSSFSFSFSLSLSFTKEMQERIITVKEQRSVSRGKKAQKRKGEKISRGSNWMCQESPLNETLSFLEMERRMFFLDISLFLHLSFDPIYPKERSLPLCNTWYKHRWVREAKRWNRYREREWDETFPSSHVKNILFACIHLMREGEGER